MKKLLALLLAVAVLFALAACANTDEGFLTPSAETSSEAPTEDPGAVPIVSGPALTLTEQRWTGWVQEQPEPVVTVFTDLSAGTVIYENSIDGRIEVAQVTDEKIVLAIDHSCFVEQNEDGTVNLSADRLDRISIDRGEEKKITTATLDAGMTLFIKYE